MSNRTVKCTLVVTYISSLGIPDFLMAAPTSCSFLVERNRKLAILNI